MSDSDDDYMSEKLLAKCQEDVRPGLLFTPGEKHKLEVFKKRQEDICKRPRSLLEQEAETRDKGLTTAISSENKGFKLLEKMGFKPGEGLGKSKSGLKEPVNIVLKQGTSGVGKERYDRDVMVRKTAQKQKHQREYENKFRSVNIDKCYKKILRRDFLKAQSVCEELDFRKNISNPVEEFYWTRDTIKKRRMEERAGSIDLEYESDDDTEFDEYITEDNLASIIDYLREKHVYCLYCVITGANQEDLQENCPGPYRIDHDLDFE